MYYLLFLFSVVLRKQSPLKNLEESLHVVFLSMKSSVTTYYCSAVVPYQHHDKEGKGKECKTLLPQKKD